MLNLGKLRIVRRDTAETRSFAFVGVRRNPIDGVEEFWLPQGFQDFPQDSYKETVRLFFTLYKVMRIFADAFSLRDNNDELPREAFEVQSGDILYRTTGETPLITFAKLNIIEDVLASFDEVLLSAVVTKQTSRPPQDYEEIHRHLHRATYLPDDTIYLEEASTSRFEMERTATELVRMFCYVCAELDAWLFTPSRLPSPVIAAAQAFKEEHFSEVAGLFSEDGFELTLNILRDRLGRIERETAYKDDDFWALYRPLDMFLHGEIDTCANNDGIVWGVTDYHPIWEDMCHAYTRQFFKGKPETEVILADSPRSANTSIGRRYVYSRFGDDYPFRLTLNSKSRPLFPDLIATREVTKDLATTETLNRLVVKGRHGATDICQQISVYDSRGTKKSELWLSNLARKINKAGFRARLERGVLLVRSIPTKLWDDLYSEMVDKWAQAWLAGDKPECFVIDFKYLDPSAFYALNLTQKLVDDIRKQQVYALAMDVYNRKHWEGRFEVKNQFLIPIYRTGDDEDFTPLPIKHPKWATGTELNKHVRSASITIFALQFDKAAYAYCETYDTRYSRT